MMPAVNYEPAGVMARIKKLDIGSLFKKKKDKNKNKSHPVLLGGLFKQRHWLLTLQHRSRRDLWTNRPECNPLLHYRAGVFQILPR